LAESGTAARREIRPVRRNRVSGLSPAAMREAVVPLLFMVVASGEGVGATTPSPPFQGLA